jgi:uncharacterized cupredoxin-like copper-binding protein
MVPRLLASALLAASVSLPNASASAVPPKVRMIPIDMQAIHYSTTLITVKAGEPVDLRFRNTSTLTHEALIGDQKIQDEHEKLASGGMSMPDTRSMITVKANATKTLRYTFPKAGRTIIGCHQPGHYGTGMKLTVIVQPRTPIG